jgi:hypothetical protein
MPLRAFLAALALGAAQDNDLEKLKPRIREALGAAAPGDRARALAELAAADRAFSKAEFQAFEKVIEEPRALPALDASQELSLEIPGGRGVRVRVVLPERYDPKKAWPLLVAMGGGPVRAPGQVKEQAEFMLSLWKRTTRRLGWVLAVIEDPLSVALEAPELRYRTLLPSDLRAAVEAVRARVQVHPLKVCATGLSLGANYAIQFAAHSPDLLAGIFPVVSEGESRDAVLRNLQPLSVYAANGAKDRAIRTIEGPRRMGEILKGLGLRAHCEEDPQKGHDSFQERYVDVLPWLEKAPRNPWPKLFVRVPHEGLFGVSRRLYWIEADSDQATFRAEAKGQEIAILAARTRRLRVWLGDALADLDKPLKVTVNGRAAFEGKVARSIRSAVAAAAQDRAFVPAAALDLEVPLDLVPLGTAHQWTATLAPSGRETKLPWWEHYALLTLAERNPRPGLEGEKLPLAEAASLKFPEGLTGVRLTKVAEGSPEAAAGLKAGDVLAGFEDEVFYRDGLGVSLMAERLLRLPEPPAGYTVRVLRPSGAEDVAVRFR